MLALFLLSIKVIYLWQDAFNLIVGVALMPLFMECCKVLKIK